MAKINILHTIDTGGPGGAETIFVQLATGLNKKIFNSHVLIPEKGWIFEELKQKGLTPNISGMKGNVNVNYLLDLIKIILKYKVDIIQSHFMGSNTYCSLAGIICRVPIVSTFHGMIDVKKNDPLLSYRTYIINKGSKRVVFVSKILKNIFFNYMKLDRNKTVTIYNGIDLSKFNPDKNNLLKDELHLDHNDILIGSIGNIHPVKGYDILLNVASKVVKQNPRFKFVIIGQGEGQLYDNLLKIRSELQLEKNVFFLGYRNDICKILNAIDLLLLTSSSEGFSLAIVEAMACGVPVIATRCGGPEEIIQHRNNGILVPVAEINEISREILELSGDDKLRREVIKNAKKTAIARFDMVSMINSYESLYKEIFLS